MIIAIRLEGIEQGVKIIFHDVLTFITQEIRNEICGFGRMGCIGWNGDAVTDLISHEAGFHGFKTLKVQLNLYLVVIGNMMLALPRFTSFGNASIFKPCWRMTLSYSNA